MFICADVSYNVNMVDVCQQSNLIYVSCIKIAVKMMLLLCLCFQLSDAQTLSESPVSLRKLYLTVSHTDCSALSTVCSLRGVSEFILTVRSDVKASP